MQFLKDCLSERHKVLAWLGLLSALILTAIVATPNVAVADDNTEDAKYSMYKSASFAASYFDQHRLKVSEATSGDGEVDAETGGDKNWNEGQLDWRKAGGYLGFIDPNYGDSVFGFFSQLTSAEMTFSYSSLSGSGGTNSADQANAHYLPFREYVMYGHALKQIGVDETDSAGFLINLGNIGRGFLGGILYFSYVIASIADFVFWAIVNLLKSLNPFAWFAGFIENVTQDETGIIAWDNSGIKAFFASIYSAFTEGQNSIRTIVITLMGVFLVVGILFSAMKGKGGNSGGKIKRFIFKVAFMVLAIPILGSLYTNVLSYLSDNLSLGSATGWSNPTRIIASTIVDFQGWAETANLALPGGTSVATYADGSLDLTKSSTPKTLARRINEQTNHVTDGNQFATKSWLDQLLYGNDLIMGMMNGADYSESAYETEFKARLDGSNLTGQAIAPNLYTLDDMYIDMEETSRPEVYKNKAVFTGTDRNKNGRVAYQYFRGIGYGESKYQSNMIVTATNDNNSDLGFVFSSGGDNNTMDYAAAGLTPMSMYNYLASDFKDSSVSIYSSHKISSGSTRTTHKSVNVVGESPIHKGLNALVAATEMTVMGVIAFGYGFGLLAGALKSAFKLLTAVPLAMLGVFKSMIKVLVIFVGLIGEIIITALAYVIVSQFVMLINESLSLELINSILTNVGGAMVNGAVREVGGYAVGSTITWGVPASINIDSVAGQTLSTNPLFSIFGSVFLIIFNIVFCVFSMKLRRPLVSGVMGTMNETLERMLDMTTSNRLASSAGGSTMQGSVRSPVGSPVGSAMRQAANDSGVGKIPAMLDPTVPPGTKMVNAIDDATGGKVKQAVMQGGKMAAEAAAGEAAGPAGVAAVDVAAAKLGEAVDGKNGSSSTDGKTANAARAMSGFEQSGSPEEAVGKALVANVDSLLDTDKVANDNPANIKNVLPEQDVLAPEVGFNDDGKQDLTSSADLNADSKGTKDVKPNNDNESLEAEGKLVGQQRPDTNLRAGLTAASKDDFIAQGTDASANGGGSHTSSSQSSSELNSSLTPAEETEGYTLVGNGDGEDGHDGVNADTERMSDGPNRTSYLSQEDTKEADLRANGDTDENAQLKGAQAQRAKTLTEDTKANAQGFNLGDANKMKDLSANPYADKDNQRKPLTKEIGGRRMEQMQTAKDDQRMVGTPATGAIASYEEQGHQVATKTLAGAPKNGTVRTTNTNIPLQRQRIVRQGGTRIVETQATTRQVDTGTRMPTVVPSRSMGSRPMSTFAPARRSSTSSRVLRQVNTSPEVIYEPDTVEVHETIEEQELSTNEQSASWLINDVISGGDSVKANK